MNTLKFLPKIIAENQSFIGRIEERSWLDAVTAQPNAKMIITYGRCRVGKTELMEQYFADRCVLKFEGLENLDIAHQLEQCKRELIHYLPSEPSVRFISFKQWGDFFELLSQYTKTGEVTLYFEEVQWLSQYGSEFVSYLKYYWDNYFRHNPGLIIILCGSSTSFMVNQVIKSKALHNRALHSLPLKPFSIQEARLFFKRDVTDRQLFNTYLLVGGVAEYLKYLQNAADLYLELCQQSFKSNGFFFNEYDKIFSSSLGDNPLYKNIVEYLSMHKYATRQQLIDDISKLSDGGTLSNVLFDLEDVGFIEQYHPFHLGESSKTLRYRVQDAFLSFYCRFIKPNKTAIVRGDFEKRPTSALLVTDLYQHLGYEFERYCIRNAHRIAELLGFSGIDYRAGSYFNRNKANFAYQIDLIFERADHVYTVCEIKYTQEPVGVAVIDAFARRLERLAPPKKTYAVQRVLISASGVTKDLEYSHYFDRVITLEDFI